MRNCHVVRALPPRPPPGCSSPLNLQQMGLKGPLRSKARCVVLGCIPGVAGVVRKGEERACCCGWAKALHYCKARPMMGGRSCAEGFGGDNTGGHPSARCRRGGGGVCAACRSGSTALCRWDVSLASPAQVQVVSASTPPAPHDRAAKVGTSPNDCLPAIVLPSPHVRSRWRPVVKRQKWS